MDHEIINRVEVNDANELFLGLEGKGKSIYQYIYREGSGVYWDEQNHGFKSTELKEWGCSKWFSHIIGVAGGVRSCFVHFFIAYTYLHIQTVLV